MRETERPVCLQGDFFLNTQQTTRKTQHLQCEQGVHVVCIALCKFSSYILQRDADKIHISLLNIWHTGSDDAFCCHCK